MLGACEKKVPRSSGTITQDGRLDHAANPTSLPGRSQAARTTSRPPIARSSSRPPKQAHRGTTRTRPGPAQEQWKTSAAEPAGHRYRFCLLYTSDAADDLLCVDLGGRRIIK